MVGGESCCFFSGRRKKGVTVLAICGCVAESLSLCLHWRVYGINAARVFSGKCI